MSYADLYNINLYRDEYEDIEPGMIVATGPNMHPQFEVLAVHGDKAWVRNVDKPWEAGGITEVTKCRQIKQKAPEETSEALEADKAA